LKVGEEHDFAIKETNAWQKLLWAVRATDPAARIAAWIAVWRGIIEAVMLAMIPAEREVPNPKHQVPISESAKKLRPRSSATQFPSAFTGIAAG
jgi:hypothetical protein